MTTTAYGSAAAMAIVRRAPESTPPSLNPTARTVLAEIGAWHPVFARGEAHGADGRPGWLQAGERFAVRIQGVRAAGLARRPVRGTLYVTDRRAVLTAAKGRTVREWALPDLAAVTALGNWGGLALVHHGGDTELVVAAEHGLPSWRDATPWLKVEAAFAAAEDRLEQWVAELPRRLALVGDA